MVFVLWGHAVRQGEGLLRMSPRLWFSTGCHQLRIFHLSASEWEG